jgi:hypothetical protein
MFMFVGSYSNVDTFLTRPFGTRALFYSVGSKRNTTIPVDSAGPVS